MKTNATMCIFLILSLITNAYSIGVSTGICSTLAVACYSAAWFVFGTVTAGLGIPPALIGCNAAFGTCMATCSVATLLLP